MRTATANEPMPTGTPLPPPKPSRDDDSDIGAAAQALEALESPPPSKKPAGSKPARQVQADDGDDDARDERSERKREAPKPPASNKRNADFARQDEDEEPADPIDDTEDGGNAPERDELDDIADRFRDNVDDEGGEQPANQPRQNQPNRQTPRNNAAPDRSKPDAQDASALGDDDVRLIDDEDLETIESVTPELAKPLRQANQRFAQIAKQNQVLIGVLENMVRRDGLTNRAAVIKQFDEWQGQERDEYGRADAKGGIKRQQMDARTKVINLAQKIQQQAMRDEQQPEYIPMDRALQIADRVLFPNAASRKSRTAEGDPRIEKVKSRHRMIDPAPGRRAPMDGADEDMAAARAIENFTPRRMRR